MWKEVFGYIKLLVMIQAPEKEGGIHKALRESSQPYNPKPTSLMFKIQQPELNHQEGEREEGGCYPEERRSCRFRLPDVRC